MIGAHPVGPTEFFGPVPLGPSQYGNQPRLNIDAQEVYVSGNSHSTPAAAWSVRHSKRLAAGSHDTKALVDERMKRHRVLQTRTAQYLIEPT